MRLSIDCFTVRKYVSTAALDTRPCPNSESTVDCVSLSLAYLNEKHWSLLPYLRQDVPIEEISQDAGPEWKIGEPLMEQLHNLRRIQRVDWLRE